MSYPLRSKRGPNLEPQQRIISLLAGAGLLLLAARKSWLLRAPLMLGSGFMFFRSFSGRDPISQSLGIYKEDGDSTVRVQRAITINRPRSEVYAFWHDFKNLPLFMRHLESVEFLPDDHQTSHWVARAPLGTTVEWDAQIDEERQDEFISWHSLPGSKVENTGKVKFNDAIGLTGTEIKVDLKYRPPLGGTAGVVLSRLAGEEPDQQVREDLRRLKRILETGEVISVEGQPSGPVAGKIAAIIEQIENKDTNVPENTPAEVEVSLDAGATNEFPLDTFSRDDRIIDEDTGNIIYPAGQTTRGRKPRKGRKVS